jgi:hypothetical protein
MKTCNKTIGTITAIVSLGLLCGIMPAANAQEVSPPAAKSILINGRTVNLEAQPIQVGKTLMLPLRALGEYLGCRVEWDKNTRNVRLEPSEGKRATTLLTVGNPEARIGDRNWEMKVAPIVRQGRVFIPLREVACFLGARVQYEADTRVLTIQVPSLRDNPKVDTDYFAREWA